MIVYIGVSLDGLFQGTKSWEIEFLRRKPSREVTEFHIEMERQAGALLLGRKTYAGFAAFWPHGTGPESELMNGLPKVVISMTMNCADW